MKTVDVRAQGNAVSISVRVKPRASKSRVLGVLDGHLVVSLAAPPVDGAANAELCRLLSGELRIAKGRVTIGGGARGRQKRVILSGVSEAQLAEYLEALVST